jgi:hypothetical protein
MNVPGVAITTIAHRLIEQAGTLRVTRNLFRYPPVARPGLDA